jgi:hypothetical protein
LLILAAAVALAVALLATAGAAAPTDPTPMFSFCDGRIVEISEIRPCLDGSLRIVR